jgi:hypothetical protein
VARKLKQVLDKGDEQQIRQLEEATDMSRVELQQFAERFARPDLEAAREGQTIQGDQPEAKAMPPQEGLGERIKGSLTSGSSERKAGFARQDQFNQDTQGIRTEAPAEYRSRFEAFKSSISRSRGSNARP